MKRSIFVIVVLVTLTGLCFGSAFATETAEDNFVKANHLYAKGDYQGAVSLYEHALSEGTHSGNLYYNMGNAYFKLGQKGKALLNYERARREMPQDEDLYANYGFVKSLLELREPEEAYPWYIKAFLKVRDSFPAGGWFVFSLLVYWALILFVSLTLFVTALRKRLPIAVFIVSVLFLVSLVFFFQKAQSEQNTHYGIIVSPTANVRYSPSYSGAEAFELREGIKAQILRREGDWIQVRLAQNRSGWVEASSIEEI